MSGADAAADYRVTSVPDLSEAESVAVVLALVQLGELPPPGAVDPVAARGITPTSDAGRRRAARFQDVWSVGR